MTHAYDTVVMSRLNGISVFITGISIGLFLTPEFSPSALFVICFLKNFIRLGCATL